MTYFNMYTWTEKEAQRYEVEEKTDNTTVRVGFYTIDEAIKIFTKRCNNSSNDVSLRIYRDVYQVDVYK